MVKGQWVTDQRIWVYKTHYPARIGKGIFEFDKVLLVTRNAFDALDSMFNLYLTNSHYKNIKKEEYERLFQDWEGLIKEEVFIWNKFYEFWYNLSITNKIPLYVVKYENLITNTRDEILNILKFLLNYRNLEGTIIEQLTDDYLKNRRVVYKPRKGTNFHSLENFTKQQIKFVLENSIKMFYLFEYDKQFEDLIKEYNLSELYSKFENLDVIERYSNLNEQILNKVCLNEFYPYDLIRVPARGENNLSNINTFSLDSEKNMLKYCKNHRSGPRMARLSLEMSKIVRVEEEN